MVHRSQKMNVKNKAILTSALGKQLFHISICCQSIWHN